NVNALQRLKLRTAIDVTANYRPPRGARIIKNGIDPTPIRRGSRRRRGISRVLNETFAVAPSIILAATGIGRLLNINFFARALADVADEHAAGHSIEAVAIRISQTERPNFPHWR